MKSNLRLHANYEKDRFMQKWIIPPDLFRTLNIAVGDYVEIHVANVKFICRVHANVQPHQCVFTDNIVTSESFSSNNDSYWTATIPDNLKVITPSNFERISVSLIYNINESIPNCKKIVFEDLMYKIMKGYVFEEKCVINCSGLKVADLFHVNSIRVSETFPKTVQYGKLIKSSQIEITEFKSVDQMCLINKFQNLHLGGISDTLNLLKSYLCLAPTRILVSGPAGSGKSTLVKKFLSDTNCFFIIIDGLKDLDLVVNKSELIYEQFHNYLKIFPNHSCVLFMDHIDVMVPNSSKQKTTLIPALTKLAHKLTCLSVSVIVAAPHRNNFNSKLSSLFVKEVTLGMPSFQQRKEMLKCLTESLKCDVNFDEIAQRTPGFVAHDITLLFSEALKNNSNSLEKPDVKLTTEDFLSATAKISPSVLKTSIWNMKVEPVHWNDIGGMFDIKQRLQMCIEQRLQNPDILKQIDLPCPHGILLFGPPGCCKTTLARALATECNANFFSTNPSQLYSPFVGESEKNISKLFYQARLSAPSIIFLDEIDGLVTGRSLDNKSHGIGEKVLSALLNEMDGFGTKVQCESSLTMQRLLNRDEIVQNLNDKVNTADQHFGNDVIVVAATNRPDLLDDALLRPGRFDIILYAQPPNEEERESILLTLLKDKPVQNVNIKYIAKETELYSGADLKNICIEAGKKALRYDITAAQCITEEMFLEALKESKPSLTKQQIEMYENLSSKYGTVIK